MKVKEIMERVGSKETGRALAYIKDGMEEINTIAETHVKAQRIDLYKNKRFYDLPNDLIQVKEVRMKNQLNNKDEYRSIPRLIYRPTVKDEDGI